MEDSRWKVVMFGGDIGLGVKFRGPKHGPNGPLPYCFRHDVDLDEKHECILCVAEDEKMNCIHGVAEEDCRFCDNTGDALRRVQANSARDRIHALTEYVRQVAYAHMMQSLDAGVCIDHRYAEDAKELVCYAEGCDNAPGGTNDKGLGYCRDHAPKMD